MKTGFGVAWILAVLLVTVGVRSGVKQNKVGDAYTDKILSSLRHKGPALTIERVKEDGYTPYNLGMALLKLTRYQDAIDWYIAMVEHCSDITEKAEYYYGKAWVHFKMGDYELSLSDAQMLIEIEPKEKTLARTYFLLGKIYLHLDNFDLASSNFEQARVVYERLGKTGGMYLSVKGMAEVALYQDKYEFAQTLLNQADEYRRIKGYYNTGNIKSLEADIFFRQQRYDEYINRAMVVLKIFEDAKDASNALWIRIKIGTAHALNCNLGLAFEIAKENNEFILASNNIVAGHYNNIIRVICRKNWGDSYQEMKADMKAWVYDTKAGDDLIQLLFLAESVQCSE